MKKENKLLKYEQGRSMVEMLGVLAIIGVLSVAGIAGYTTAMNKHRANTLLKEASKRATSVAAQIFMQGKDAENVSIAEFTNPSGYTFGVAKKNANQFNITIDAVDTDICTQMKAAAGTNTPIRKINDACTELTFNNDMSTTVWASDYETKEACVAGGKSWCEGSGTCSEGECCATGDCAASSCPAGSSTAGQGGNTGVYVGTEQCRCDNNGEYYTQNGCEVPADTCTSWTTNECGKGRYCDFGYNVTDNRTGVADACYKDLAGTCADISDNDSNGGYTWSTTSMRWWNAASWCLGQGKHLIDVEELNCHQNGTSTQITSGSSAGGSCCKEANGQCSGYWDDDTNRVTYFSAKITDIKAKVNNTTKNYWTASPYGNTSPNSCYAFGMGLYSGDVGSFARSTRIYALCE